jgi:molybdopterin molybdotransferase/molybdopterin-guanine dinucleotide biosynthesis protein B
MRLWGVVGRKDCGKTTLTERLVAELRARGLRVSTLKRSHHALDLDRPGTDSHRHRMAGAGQVMLLSDARLALMEELPAPAPLDALVARLAPCDVVLAEGWKRGTHARIEAWRAACGTPPLAAADPGIRAVAADAPVDVGCPVYDLDDVTGLADLICSS